MGVRVGALLVGVRRLNIRKQSSVGAIVAVLSMAGLSVAPVQASNRSQTPAVPKAHFGRLQGFGVVNARQLPPAARAAVHTSHPRVLPGRAAEATRTPSPLRSADNPPLKGLTSNATQATTQGTVEEQLTAFLGMDVAQGSAAFGNDQNSEPPDTHLAAGPTALVEVVNSNMSVWSKAGTRLAVYDLNNFFAVPPGYSITDPRVLYDVQSGRFITTAFALNSSYLSNVYLAISQTSDPTGVWYHWAPKSTTQPVITDQPKVGVTDDKVTISWAEGFGPPCSAYCYSGQVTMVVLKSDLVGVPPATSPRFVTYGPDINRFGIVPVQSLSSTNIQYLVYNNADPYYGVENYCGAPPANAYYWNCPTLGLIAITGNPVTATGTAEWDLPIAATTAPPAAVQLGSATKISTNDDRLLSAVWQDNTLTTALTDGNYCGAVNPAATPLGSCLRMLQVSTVGSPSLLSQVQLGSPGDYLYDPALSVDRAGDVITVMSRSNAGLHPGVWVTGRRSAGSTWSAPSMLRDGTGPYDSTIGCGGQNRWGDYSGAATDPTDTTDVWVAGEYALNNPNNACTWGTAIGRLTYSLPTVTSITPNNGPRAGGTSVTITGTDFLAGATRAYLASAQATNVVVQSPDHLTAVIPYGNGVVPVSAATPEGQGPAGPTYTYAPRSGSPSRPTPGGRAKPTATAPPALPPLPVPVNRPPPPPPALLDMLQRLSRQLGWAI